MPHFQDNLISIGQLADKHNVVFTKEGVFLAPREPHPQSATKIGFKGADNLFILFTPTTHLTCRPGRCKAPSNPALNQTLNHSYPQSLAHFRELCSEALRYNVDRLRTEKS